jgi:hypothetical protein
LLNTPPAADLQTVHLDPLQHLCLKVRIPFLLHLFVVPEIHRIF